VKTIYSFDVFDTLLCRPYVLPVDVFSAIEKKLQSVFPEWDKKSNKSFSQARVFSEFIARRKTTYEDITINNIYLEFGRLFNLTPDILHQLMLYEMQYEKEILSPISGAAQYVDVCRNQGEIIFISDMYLPSEFIMNILIDNKIAKIGERIYVSGEYGLTKGSGGLFNKVLRDFSISAPQLVHFGDNLISDYIVPVGIGITFNDFMGLPKEHRAGKFNKVRKKISRSLSMLKLFWSLYV